MEENNLAKGVKKGALLRAVFCFYDESGFSERPTVRRTWGKQGETPVIRSTGSWKNISATGIVATDAEMKNVRALCTFTKGAVHQEDTVRTLRHLARHIKRPIALLWDGLAQHRAKIVREFLAHKKNRFVIVERFPAYAPELNPQEYVLASSKTKDMAKHTKDVRSVLIVVDDSHRALEKVTANIPTIRVRYASSVTPKDILEAQAVWVDIASMKILEVRCSL